MIDVTYNHIDIILSFAFSFLGCYMAISLSEQLRVSYMHGEKFNWKIRSLWMISIGLALGGVGKWAMHFIGMSAITIRDSHTNEELKVGYNLEESIGSLLATIVLTIIGVTIASNDRLFAKTQSEIMEMFIQDSHAMSIQKVKNASGNQIIWLISTKEPWNLLLGGTVTAAGVILGHYINMNSMEFEDEIVIVWQAGDIIASVIIAIIACTFSFWVLFRFLSIFPLLEYLRIISAVVVAGSICGMHYIGMFAAVFEHNKSVDGMKYHSFTPDHLKANELIPVVTAATIVLWILAVINLADARMVANKYRTHLIKQHFKIAGATSKVSGVGSYLENISLHESKRKSKKGKVLPSRMNSQSRFSGSSFNPYRSNQFGSRILDSRIVQELSSPRDLLDKPISMSSSVAPQGDLQV